MRETIGRPASYAALKTVVETWHTPPPRPVFSSPLMITGASTKPLSCVRAPVVPLNENFFSGRDHMLVDEVRDELHVVDAARFPAVERLVARDEAGDVHGLRLSGRPVGIGALDDELCRAQGGVGDEGGLDQRLRAPRDVEGVAGMVRDDADAFRADGPVGVGRRVVDSLRQGREPFAGPGATDPEVAATVGGQLQQAGELGRAEIPARRIEREVHVGGERRSHLRLRDLEVAGRHLRPVDVDGQTHRFALQAGERAHDRGGGGVPVEHVPRSRADDVWAQSLEDDRSFTCGTIDGSGDLVELPLQRRVVHLRRRCDVRAEEAQVETAEAAERAEAVPLAADRVDGCSPVHLDAEAARLEPPRAGADPERDRHPGERLRPALEDRPGLARRLAADVDAGDADAVAEARRGAGEGEAEHDRGERRQRRDNHQPLPEQALLGARLATARGSRQAVFPAPRQDEPV